MREFHVSHKKRNDDVVRLCVIDVMCCITEYVACVCDRDVLYYGILG